MAEDFLELRSCGPAAEAKNSGKTLVTPLQGVLGGRFGSFLFFSARGRGRESPRRREGGQDDFLLKIPGGGGLPGGWGRACGRAGRVFAGNWGGGPKYFVSGSKLPPRVWDGGRGPFLWFISGLF